MYNDSLYTFHYNEGPCIYRSMGRCEVYLWGNSCRQFIEMNVLVGINRRVDVKHIYGIIVVEDKVKPRMCIVSSIDSISFLIFCIYTLRFDDNNVVFV